MVWKNRLLSRIKYHTAENFTTDFGIKMRRFIWPLVHFAICHFGVNKPYEVKRYPKVEKGKPCIFAAGHLFTEEVATNLTVLDRSTWVLVGTTDQVDYNPRFLFLWLCGVIFVNKKDGSLRQDAFKKMKRILDSGSSIILYPEGGLNHSENEYIRHLFPGIYHLSKATEAPIVPIISEEVSNGAKIHIAAGEPINAWEMEKDEALAEVRGAMSTLRFELGDSEVVERKSLVGDLHMSHMQNRLDGYLETKWVNPDWDEEMMYYTKPGYVSYEEAFGALDNVKVTPENAHIIAPVLARLEECRRYDLKRFIKDNWKRRQKELRGRR